MTSGRLLRVEGGEIALGYALQDNTKRGPHAELFVSDFARFNPMLVDEVESFQIAEYCVSQAEFKAWHESKESLRVMTVRRHDYWSSYWDSSQYREEYPIIGISYWEALGYCQSFGCRLATYAEWMRASRAPGCVQRDPDLTHANWNGDPFEPADENITSLYRDDVPRSWCGVAELWGNCAEFIFAPEAGIVGAAAWSYYMDVGFNSNFWTDGARYMCSIPSLSTTDRFRYVPPHIGFRLVADDGSTII